MRRETTYLAAALAATIVIIGFQQASARGLDYRGDGPQQPHRQETATNAKMEKFRVDSLGLRKQIAVKQAEKSALIRSESPNIEAVKKAAGELFDLKIAMREKVKASGLFTFTGHGDEYGRIAEKHARLNKFLEDTREIRKQLVVKQAEKHALMNSRIPDVEAVVKAAGELFDLRNTIHEKAKTAGLSRHFHSMGKGRMEHGRQAYDHDSEDYSGLQNFRMI